MCSLFHDEKFPFFDFGVRGTPKILIIFLGVPAKFLKKVGVLPGAVKGFCLRREAAPGRSRFAVGAKPFPGARQNRHFFPNFGRKP